MASLTSNPMEEMMEEEEYQASDTNKNISGAGGYRRSWSNPGPEPDSNRPNTLRLCSGNNAVFFCVTSSYENVEIMRMRHLIFLKVKTINTSHLFVFQPQAASR